MDLFIIQNSSAGICFAIKANPFLTGRIAEMVDRIEVCSMGEFEITVVKSGRCICFWYGIRFISGKENFREREDLLRDSQKKRDIMMAVQKTGERFHDVSRHRIFPLFFYPLFCCATS